MNWLELYRQKLEDRVNITRLCDEDNEAKVIAKELCKRDCKFFINNFCWTYDPRPDKNPHHFPFLMYPIQDSYIDFLNDCFARKIDGLTEKSRDMGATWLYLTWDLWHWLFDDVFQSLLGSRKEDLVDRSDNPDSLFWKLEYQIKNLPNWLLPKDFNPEKHRKHMLITNPTNDNAIVGESANADFSRQGRYTVVHFDEFAFWPWGYASWTAAGDAAQIRLPVSTVHGKNNKFSDLKHNSSISVFVLDWKDHPLKTDDWYKKEKERRTAKELAQEVDRDYSASGGDLFLPWYVQKRHEIEVLEPIKPQDEWNLYASIDYGSRNPSAVTLYGIDYDFVIYAYAEFYKPSSVKEIADWLKSQDTFLRLKWISADPQLWAKDQERDGRKLSRFEMFQELGVNLTAGPKGLDLDARELTKEIILSNRLKISPVCKAQRWEFGGELKWSDYTEQVGQQKGFKEELLDKNNHCFDNWKYFILNRPKAPTKPPKPQGIKPVPITPKQILDELSKKQTIKVGQYATKK